MPLLRTSLFAAALALGPVAQAADGAPAGLPPGGSGLLSLWAGARWVPQDGFAADLKKSGLSIKSRPGVLPSVLLPFGYRVDAEWTALIEFGYALDRFALANGGSLGVDTISVQVGFERTFAFTPRLEAFLGAGTGYYLSSVAQVAEAGGAAKSIEAHTTGFFAVGGLRWAMTSDWGLALQERYALAYAGAEGLGNLNVGGSTTALGLYYVWRD